MATEFIKSIKCGNKKYNISASGETVYYSSSNKTGGTHLKKARIYKNELQVKNEDDKWVAATAVTLCSTINSNKSSGCFISTAVYSATGLGDQCEQLMTLRQFRDDIISKDPCTRHLIDEYYKIAPEICCKIESNPMRDEIYKSAHADLDIIISLIRSEKFSDAIEKYALMIDKIKKTLSNSSIDKDHWHEQN